MLMFLVLLLNLPASHEVGRFFFAQTTTLTLSISTDEQPARPVVVLFAKVERKFAGTAWISFLAPQLVEPTPQPLTT